MINLLKLLYALQQVVSLKLDGLDHLCEFFDFSLLIVVPCILILHQLAVSLHGFLIIVMFIMLFIVYLLNLALNEIDLVELHLQDLFMILLQKEVIKLSVTLITDSIEVWVFVGKLSPVV